jgi:hypothetical protein
MYAFFPSIQQQKEMGRYEKWKLWLALLPELPLSALLEAQYRYAGLH